MWYIYALIAAVFQWTEAIFSKRLVQHITPLQMWRGVSVIEFFIILIITVVTGQWMTWWSYVFFQATIIVAVAMVFIRRWMSSAFQKSDIGIVVPMMSFIPVFSAILWIFILWEIPSIIGVWGISLVVVGSFLLQFDKRYTWQKILLAPFTDPWARIMIWVSLLWAIASVYAKIAIHEMNVYMYMVWMWWIAAILMSIPIIRKKEWKMKLIYRRDQVIIAFLKAWWRLTMLMSYMLLYVAYTLSIKRLSAVLAVILWYIFLKEEQFKEKLWWSLCMLSGVALLVFFW